MSKVLFNWINLILVWPVSLFRAFVFSSLWNWFAIAYFRLPPLGVLRAFAFVLLFQLAESARTETKEGDDAAIRRFGWLLGRALFFATVLLVAWIILRCGGAR